MVRLWQGFGKALEGLGLVVEGRPFAVEFPPLNVMFLISVWFVSTKLHNGNVLLRMLHRLATVVHGDHNSEMDLCLYLP